MSDDPRSRRLLALRNILRTPQGRELIAYYLEDIGGLHRNPMTGNSQTFFNAGVLAFAQQIRVDCIDADRKLYQQMEDEYLTKLATEASTTEEEPYDG